MHILYAYLLWSHLQNVLGQMVPTLIPFVERIIVTALLYFTKIKIPGLCFYVSAFLNFQFLEYYNLYIFSTICATTMDNAPRVLSIVVVHSFIVTVLRDVIKCKWITETGFRISLCAPKFYQDAKRFGVINVVAYLKSE